MCCSLVVMYNVITALWYRLALICWSLCLRFGSFSPEPNFQVHFLKKTKKHWTVRRWKKPRASSCRRGIISRKQACQPTERCDVHTERCSMHVLLQAEWRRRHLKQNFKWRHERRRQEAPKSSMGCWCVRCSGACACNFMSSYVYAHWMT